MPYLRNGERRFAGFPRDTVAILAVRAAMRVLPLLPPPGRAWFWSDRSGENMLAILRSLQTAALLAQLSDSNKQGIDKQKIEEAARVVSIKSKAAAHSTLGTLSTGEEGSLDYWHGVEYANQFADDRARPYTNVVRNVALSASLAFLGSEATVEWAIAAANKSACEHIAAIEADIALMEAGNPQESNLGAADGSFKTSLLSKPLWSGETPREIRCSWQSLRNYLRDLDEGFEIWIDWYEKRLQGEPFNLEAEHKRAQLSEERLSKSPAEINAYLLKAERQSARFPRKCRFQSPAQPVSPALPQADLCLSYSSHDATIIEKLDRELNEMGFTVWYDSGFDADQLYCEVLQQRIKAVKAVVVVQTHPSIMSKWVRAEAELAGQHDKLIYLHESQLSGSWLPMPFAKTHRAIGFGNMPALLKALALKGAAPRT
jgi:hypothetical protein